MPSPGRIVDAAGDAVRQVAKPRVRKINMVQEFHGMSQADQAAYLATMSDAQRAAFLAKVNVGAAAATGARARPPAAPAPSVEGFGGKPTFDNIQTSAPATPDFSPGSPTAAGMDASVADGVLARTPSNLRNQRPFAAVGPQSVPPAPPAPPATSRYPSLPGRDGLGVDGAVLAGGAAVAGGFAAIQGDLTSTGGTADLAAESRPAPAVAAPPAGPTGEDRFTEKFKKEYLERDAAQREDRWTQNAKASYLQHEDRRQARAAAPQAPAPQAAPQAADPSSQAHAMIAKLNAMRRQAGGEVPQAPQMMAEINRLIELGNRQRNAPRPQAAPAQQQPRGPVQSSGQAAQQFQAQARSQMALLNQYRAQGRLSPATERQMTAEINHLFHLADEARAGR